MKYLSEITEVILWEVFLESIEKYFFDEAGNLVIAMIIMKEQLMQAGNTETGMTSPMRRRISTRKTSIYYDSSKKYVNKLTQHLIKLSASKSVSESRVH